MRVAYYMSSNFSHFSEIRPYYEYFGGLVHTTSPDIVQFFKQKYPQVSVTTDIEEVRAYKPDVFIYATMQLVYGPWKHVQVFHGASDKPYYFEHQHEMESYDLCLCYGQREIDKFNRKGFSIKSALIGCAKLELSTPQLPKLFAQTRPLIFYAPSWREFSSLKTFADSVFALSEEYNVIVKPHAATGPANCPGHPYVKYLAEKQNENFRVVQTDNLVSLLKSCDLFLGDIGGSIYEAMFFDKPVLALNPDANRFKASKDLFAPTYLWSFIDVVHEPSALGAMVKSTISDDPRAESRREMSAYSFYREEGSSAAERGVSAIRSLTASVSSEQR